MGRAPCCEKVGMKKGRWTTEEDEILTKYVQANGEGSWRSLPKKAGLKRCGKSCRLRWFNYLRAGLKKGNITPQEEQVIVSLHSTLGNRWAMIASHLQGRTDNEIKNYWTSHLRRKLYRFMRKSPESNDVVPVIVNLLPPSKPKTKCGRTSRRAMKKTKTLINSDINSNPQTKKPESVVGGVDHTVSFEAETTSGNVCNNELGINVDDGDLCFDDVMDSCNLWLDGEDNGVLSCSELEAEILGGKDSERERGFGDENSSFSKDTEPVRGFTRQGSLGSELDCVLDNSLGDDRFDTCPLDAVHDDLFEWEGVCAVWQDCLNLWDEPEASLAQ